MRRWIRRFIKWATGEAERIAKRRKQLRKFIETWEEFLKSEVTSPEQRKNALEEIKKLEKELKRLESEHASLGKDLRGLSALVADVKVTLRRRENI